MSLVIRVSVNERPLWWVTARRMADVGHDARPDDVFTYRVEAVENASGSALTYLGDVSHRYGDGAGELARKALDLHRFVEPEVTP